MKISSPSRNQALVFYSQRAINEAFNSSIIPFPAGKQIRQAENNCGIGELFVAAIRTSQRESGWEGVTFLGLELAAVTLVAISLARF